MKKYRVTLETLEGEGDPESYEFEADPGEIHDAINLIKGLQKRMLSPSKFDVVRNALLEKFYKNAAD